MINNKIFIETDGKMELLKNEPTKEEYDIFIEGLSIMERNMIKSKELLISYNNRGFFLKERLNP